MLEVLSDPRAQLLYAKLLVAQKDIRNPTRIA